MTKKVSIVIPFIRPDGAKRCIDAIRKNAGVPKSRYEIVAEEDRDRIGAPRMVNGMVERAKHGLVMFLGDDTIPQPDFLAKALEAMGTLPEGWGLVGLNDLRFDGRHFATAWLADKRLMPLLGGKLVHEGYWHCFSDNELTIRCRELKRYVWTKDAKVKHANPVVDRTVAWDDDYRKVYSQEWFMHDQVLFWKRRQNGWKNKEGAKNNNSH